MARISADDRRRRHARGRAAGDQGRRAQPARRRHAVSASRTLTGRPSPARIAAAATLACTLEACAEKVGNVTPTRSFRDARFDHFALSAQALGEAVAGAAPGRVGRTVYEAVAATARVAPSNTNLGMALLFTPLAAAARARRRTAFRRRLAAVLRGLSVDDARWAYRAIRLARPGGLGRSEEAPVAVRPSITLAEAMRLAAQRDTVAAEYARGFTVTFDLALARLRRALARGLFLLDAIAQAHIELMARVPDTLIARKAGTVVAAAVADAGARGDAGGRRRDPEGARLCAAARSRPPARRESPQSRNLGGPRCRRALRVAPGARAAGDEPVPGADREGLHGLLRRSLHHLRRPRVRAPPRPQLPGGGRVRGAARRERLRPRLHAAEASAEVGRRPPGPPDAAADQERADPGHEVGYRGPGDLPRQAVRLPPGRRGPSPHPQHHRGDAGLVDCPGAPAGPGTLPAGAEAIEVEVDESSGQRAFYREQLGAGRPPGPEPP